MGSDLHARATLIVTAGIIVRDIVGPTVLGTLKPRMLSGLDEFGLVNCRQAVESRIAPATLRLLREFLPLEDVAIEVEDCAGYCHTGLEIVNEDLNEEAAEMADLFDGL